MVASRTWREGGSELLIHGGQQDTEGGWVGALMVASRTRRGGGGGPDGGQQDTEGGWARGGGWGSCYPTPSQTWVSGLGGAGGGRGGGSVLQEHLVQDVAGPLEG